MAKPKKQDIIIGSGSTKTPILATENAPTEGLSQPSRSFTSIEEGSTKPLSVLEALSLLQSLCSDLRSLNCHVAILARNDKLYLRIIPSASIGFGFSEGHITVNGSPVSKG